MGDRPNPSAKKTLRDYFASTVRVFHCRVCKKIEGTLYKHSNKGYVCGEHRYENING